MKRTRLARGSDAFVQALKVEGVKYVFGVVGNSLISLLDPFYDEQETRFIGVRHEGAASFMAATHGYLTGDPGVCVGIGGPGAINLMSPSLPSVDLPMPMIMISSAASTKLAGTAEIFIDVPSHEIFRHTAKWSVRIDRPERIPAILRKAFLMTTQKPGQVFVSITTDAVSGTAEIPNYCPSNYRELRKVMLEPDLEQIARAARLVAEAERPVILVGGEAIGATEQLVSLAERYRIPVLGDANVKGIFPENHPLYAGAIGFGFTTPSQKLFEEADVVLNAGSALDWFSVFVNETTGWVPGTWPRDCKMIQIGQDPSVVGRWFPVEIPLIASVPAAISRIQAALESLPIRPRFDDERPTRYLHMLEEWNATVEGELSSNKVPIHPARAIRDILTIVDDAYLICDASINALWAISLAKLNDWRKWIPLLGGGLGMAIPSGIVTKLLMPNKRVVGLVGDGAFSMHIQELATAAEYGTACTWCVLNDSQWGFVKHPQTLYHNKRYVGTIFVKGPDFAVVAKGFHCHGQRVVKPNEVIPAVEEALRANEKGIPAVVDIQIDPEPIQWGMKIAYDLEQKGRTEL